MLSNSITAIILPGLLMALSSASPTPQGQLAPAASVSTLEARQEGLACPLRDIPGSWWTDENCTNQSKGMAIGCFHPNVGCVSLRIAAGGFRAIYTPSWPRCKWYWYPDGCVEGGRKEILDKFGGYVLSHNPLGSTDCNCDTILWLT